VGHAPPNRRGEKDKLLTVKDSFVVKKKGLLASTAKHGNSAGEGHGYLKSWLWWTGASFDVVEEVADSMKG